MHRIGVSSSVTLGNNKCGSDIERCAEPTRAEANVDLIGPDADAFDHRGEEGTLACSGQLGVDRNLASESGSAQPLLPTGMSIDQACGSLLS
jgi:hypothetical protein